MHSHGLTYLGRNPLAVNGDGDRGEERHFERPHSGGTHMSYLRPLREPPRRAYPIFSQERWKTAKSDDFSKHS
jgi:hypothetical protein